MHLCLRLVLLILVVMVAPCAPALAQERMRIAWAGSTPSNTPIWVADQKGFFKKNGLNAEVISISASTIVIQALLTGEVDFIIAPSATLVTSRLAGADTVMVSTNLPLFIDHIVSLAEITSVEQLKGKTGGVNRLGTTSDMTLRLALRRFGIDPEKETKIIATGENPQRLAALSRNITQFTLLGEPLVREAEKMGFRDLFDIGKLKIPYHVKPLSRARKPSRNGGRWSIGSCALSPKRFITSRQTRKRPKRSSAKTSRATTRKVWNALTLPITPPTRRYRTQVPKE
jgi:ABC-type nitrate/sulfonate/bicarbonate transport system substrate-binding protein